MIIAIDFDGTVVTHDYPYVGKDINAIPILEKIVLKGHLIILWTMRSGNELQDAINWYDLNNIPLYGINNNPSQESWTKSPKAYANIYIDDTALGCPLKYDNKLSDRFFVDWNKVEKMLNSMGVI